MNAETNAGETVLLCTHGGILFALISAFDSTFGYEDYLKIGNPDLKRFVYTGKSGLLDRGFRFDLEARPNLTGASSRLRG